PGALANSSDGIRFTGTVGGTIGGAAPSARNLVSGNHGHGIHLISASGASILGNYVGLDASGGARLGNGIDGAALENSSGNEVGKAGAGNLISANTNQGISLFSFGGAAPNGNSIKGNLIGLGASGGTGLGNGIEGIRLFNAPTPTIGGTAAGEANEIARNGSGGVVVYLASTGNSIRGN